MRVVEPSSMLVKKKSVRHVYRVNFRWRPQLSDPTDELILEAAANGKAESIVTHNLRDFLPGARAFGMKVITPAQLLEELRK